MSVENTQAHCSVKMEDLCCTLPELCSEPVFAARHFALALRKAQGEARNHNERTWEGATLTRPYRESADDFLHHFQQFLRVEWFYQPAGGACRLALGLDRITGFCGQHQNGNFAVSCHGPKVLD